jgi:hypothetical protein
VEDSSPPPIHISQDHVQFQCEF